MKRPEVTYLVSENCWILTDDWTYSGHGVNLFIASGFRFDLASIPRVFWRLVSPFELSIAAPLAHDYLYRFGGNAWNRWLTREETDNLFRSIMEDEGVPWWRRNAAYRAVRMFAGFAWKNPRVNMLGGDK